MTELAEGRLRVGALGGEVSHIGPQPRSILRLRAHHLRRGEEALEVSAGLAAWCGGTSAQQRGRSHADGGARGRHLERVKFAATAAPAAGRRSLVVNSDRGKE